MCDLTGCPIYRFDMGPAPGERDHGLATRAVFAVLRKGDCSTTAWEVSFRYFPRTVCTVLELGKRRPVERRQVTETLASAGLK
jgi:hypothetical protein